MYLRPGLLLLNNYVDMITITTPIPILLFFTALFALIYFGLKKDMDDMYKKHQKKK